jgi:hypothetical protein
MKCDSTWAGIISVDFCNYVLMSFHDFTFHREPLLCASRQIHISVDFHNGSMIQKKP